jgi:predicted transcriptional regulator
VRGVSVRHMSATIRIADDVAAQLSELAERRGETKKRIVEQAIREVAERDAKVREIVERAATNRLRS